MSMHVPVKVGVPAASPAKKYSIFPTSPVITCLSGVVSRFRQEVVMGVSPELQPSSAPTQGSNQHQLINVHVRFHGIDGVIGVRSKPVSQFVRQYGPLL